MPSTHVEVKKGQWLKWDLDDSTIKVLSIYRHERVRKSEKEKEREGGGYMCVRACVCIDR